MKLNIEEKDPKYWIVEVVGEDVSLPNLLSEALVNDSDVEFAACVVEHPMVSSPKLVIRTKSKSAKSALDRAVKSAASQLKAFKTQVKKIKKK